MFDPAVAFERYRLQVAASWPDGDFKRATILAVEARLRRAQAQHAYDTPQQQASPILPPIDSATSVRDDRAL